MPYCQLCKKEVDQLHFDLEQWLIESIRSEHPDRVEDNGSCERCQQYYQDLGEIDVGD